MPVDRGNPVKYDNFLGKGKLNLIGCASTVLILAQNF
jgi:hypothetical protein